MLARDEVNPFTEKQIEPAEWSDLVRAAIEGQLPHGMGVTRLAELPAEWSRQHKVLGLPAHLGGRSVVAKLASSISQSISAIGIAKDDCVPASNSHGRGPAAESPPAPSRRTEADAVVLFYRARSFLAGWKSIEQRIPITWTNCHFGGRRPWFVCWVRANDDTAGVASPCCTPLANCSHVDAVVDLLTLPPTFIQWQLEF